MIDIYKNGKQIDKLRIYLNYFLRSLEVFFLTSIFIAICLYFQKQELTNPPFIDGSIKFIIYCKNLFRIFILLYIVIETLFTANQIFKSRISKNIFIFLNGIFFISLGNSLTVVSFLDRIFN